MDRRWVRVREIRPSWTKTRDLPIWGLPRYAQAWGIVGAAGYEITSEKAWIRRFENQVGTNRGPRSACYVLHVNDSRRRRLGSLGVTAQNTLDAENRAGIVPQQDSESSFGGTQDCRDWRGGRSFLNNWAIDLSLRPTRANVRRAWSLLGVSVSRRLTPWMDFRWCQGRGKRISTQRHQEEWLAEKGRQGRLRIWGI